MNDPSPLLNLHLFILNGRAEPWFNHLNSADAFNVTGPTRYSPIEDQKKVGIYVHSVDPINRIIQVRTHPRSQPSNSQISLARRSHLSRFEWCLKGFFVNTQSELATLKNSINPFTLVSADMDLENNAPDHEGMCISTFEMQMMYSVKEGTYQGMEESHQSLNLLVSSLCISYSYLFARLSLRERVLDRSFRNTVFDPIKVKLLVESISQVSLIWQDKYWDFDLVLHWLVYGDASDLRAVLEFLVEHEKHAASSRRSSRSPRTRYYNSPVSKT